MKKILFAFPLLITFLANTQPVIKISDGLLRGVTEGEVSIFKGIPFAAPPVGQFRWRPPQPVVSWEGIREANKFSPNCAQGGWGTAPGKIAEGSSEDCLYLNIWKPEKVKASANLPVLVWIHGGGFTGGSGSTPQNFGHEFSKQGAILVNINYRLGRLGFFAFPALSKEFPDEVKGNYGYMDQLAALKWIQKNISAFGGNPNNITIFGFSAGGVSVHTLMTITSSNGLFHKAISQSGGGRDGVLTGRPIRNDQIDSFYSISAETIGINFARKHGIENTDASGLAKLRSLSVEKIVDGGQETDGPNGPRIYSGPILDGKLVIETAETAYKNGRHAKIPIMIGNCSAEIGGSFVNSSKSKSELFSLFNEFEHEAKNTFDPNNNLDFNEVITKFNTNWVWGEPTRMTARVFTSKKVPTYVYQFGYVPKVNQQRSPYGASHGSEISFVFNTLNARWGVTSEPSSEEIELARVMSSYWVNFAKTGNPNGQDLPIWPPFNLQNEKILDIEMNGNPVGKPDPRKQILDITEKANKLKYKIQSRGI